MSLHSYSRCWIHLIWSTLHREKSINKEGRIKISKYLIEYAASKEIYMRINYVNVDHVHTLIDLPTKYSVEDVIQLLKGGSSHWINENKIVAGRFSWGRGFAAFSVSQSSVDDVVKYITNQEEHHRKKVL